MEVLRPKGPNSLCGLPAAGRGREMNQGSAGLPAAHTPEPPAAPSSAVSTSGTAASLELYLPLGVREGISVQRANCRGPPRLC